MDAFADLAALALKLGLTRSGAGFRGPCPVHGGSTSPFALRRGAGGRLLVHCHAGCAPAEIFAALRSRSLWPSRAGGEGKAPPRAPAEAPRDWSASAQMLWDRGMPIAGTPVARYLDARGCGGALGDRGDEVLRCLEAGLFGPLPCMMALVTDICTARPISLHITRLRADGTDKAAVARPKLLLTGHRKSGGCIRLSPDDEVTLGLGLAEGIETALAAMRLGFAPVWATIDAGNLKSFPVLDGIEALTLFADHDKPGIDAALECQRRWRAAGRETRLQMPDAAGSDFADLNRNRSKETLNG